MNNNEIKQLTKEILTLKSRIDDFGRKSVKMVIECGGKLKVIKDNMKHGMWNKWCSQYEDKISKSTIQRYIKVYKKVTSDPNEGGKTIEGLTLDQIYEKFQIIPQDKEEMEDSTLPEVPEEQQYGKKPRPNRFQRFVNYLHHLSDTPKYTWTLDERKEFIRCGKIFVEWYTEEEKQIPIAQIGIQEEAA